MGTIQKRITSKCVLSYMDSIQKEMYASGKKGTAGLYKATRTQVASFIGQRKLNFKQVDTQLVTDFIAYLESLSLSRNSVSNYTSIFRATYNSAVSENLVIPKENPFQKFHLRPVQSYKRSVHVDVIKEMTQMNFKNNKRLDFARDLFLFCFMACGMAFVDLAHLTTKNIHGDTLIYYRVKTKTEIRVTITPAMRYILQKYADAYSNLLFPILKSEDASYESYKVALRTYNRRLAKIGDMLSSPMKLTSYVARHTWAMCAKAQSLPISVISQALGHTSERTTLFYLDSLDQSVIDQANMKIIGFIEKWMNKQHCKN